MEGARGVGSDRGERGNSGVCVGFVLLARGTALNVLSHKLCETWPPEFGSHKLTCFEITGVSGGLVIMAVGEDGVAEGVLWGNVDMPFVGQDVVIELPVGEA